MIHTIVRPPVIISKILSKIDTLKIPLVKIKIKKAEDTIKKSLEQGKREEDPYIKGYKTRIQNRRIDMEQKIKELEQKRPVSVGFNLIAGGVVKIEK